MKNLSFVGTPSNLMEYLNNIEVKCQTRGCGRGLNRIVKYGRNICDKCEEHLLG